MSQQQFRIPTFLALLLVAAFSIGGLFTYDRFSSFFGSARTPNAIQPENIKITNITDSSLVISWETSEPIGATVQYGVNKPDNVAYDIRDTDSLPKPYKVHYVQLFGLESEQAISLQINHADSVFPIEKITLGPVISNPPQELPLYGKITTSDGTPSQGAIVYITINNEVSWSTFIAGSDSWIIPTASIRSADMRGYYCSAKPCNLSTALDVIVKSEEGTISTQSTLADARPVAETLVIGGKSTVSPTPEVYGIQTTQLVQPTNTPAPTKKPLKKQVSSDIEITILNPKKNATLRFPKPLIRGQGVPGETVEIILESAVKQIDTVTVQDNGTWLWTPKLPLEPGKHLLTIKTTDASGKTIILTNSFSIFKSGEQVLSAGTPSASINTPTPSLFEPTLTPTSTPIIPTATPLPDMPVSASYAPSILVLVGGFLLIVLAFSVI